MPRHGWLAYLSEGVELALFMLSACLATALLEHPASAVHDAIASDALRRALLGIAMGLTAALLVYSPMGRVSGAHFNPAVTLTYLRLKKIAPRDAAFYVPAQFAGGVIGVVVARGIIPKEIADPTVRFAVTVPGAMGVTAALVTELVISFVLMTVVLIMGASKRWERFAGVATGGLVALDVFFAAPISGFGMNPARTAGSAIVAGIWTSWWLYFLAPPLGMLAAAELHGRVRLLGPTSRLVKP